MRGPVAENGTELLKPLNATIKTPPVIYAVNGRQYVTLAVGSTIMIFGLPE